MARSKARSRRTKVKKTSHSRERVQAKKRKKTSRSRTRARGVRLSKSLLAQMNRDVDRYMERWARHAIIVDGDIVRRLTEEEVQMAAGKRRAGRRLSSKPKAAKKR